MIGKTGTIVQVIQTSAGTDNFTRLLGILTAVAWPVFSVLPDERLGGPLMLNGLLYAFLFLLSVVMLPRRGRIELVVIALVYAVVVHFPAIVQAQRLGIPGDNKSFDIVATHLTFILAGISAGRNFSLFAKFFLGTLLFIILINLFIELYPDLMIHDREKIGMLGGQGISRLVALTVVGYLITAGPGDFAGSKKGMFLVLLLTIGFLVFTSARSSMLGIFVALGFFVLAEKKKSVPFLLGSVFMLGLLSWMISTFYLESLRPLLVIEDPESGIIRTLLTLDIFFQDKVDATFIASVTERFDLWRDSWRIIEEHPFGTGYGGYAHFAMLGQELSPHNLIIEVVVEMGVIMGGIFLLFIAIVVFNSPRSIVPYMIVLIVLFMFSGDLVDFRQLMFFLGVTLVQLVSTNPRSGNDAGSKEEAVSR